MPLRTGHGLRFPIDGEVGEVIARFCLIPIILERRTDQIDLIARLTLDEIGGIDIACVDGPADLGEGLY